MFHSTPKLLLLSSITVPRWKSNFFVGKNVRLRNFHKKFPLDGIKVTVVKQPFIPQLISKLLENFGAEITTFCDVSNIKKFDISWTNSDFVKAHVYGNPDLKIIEAGEREIDLSVDGDLNLVKKSAEKSDIFIDGLKNNRFEEFGISPEAMLKLNSKLIIARITFSSSDLNASNHLPSIDKKVNNVEEFLTLLHQNSKTQILLGQMACFAKILLTLFNNKNAQKGEILNLSITDSLSQLERITSALPSIPKPFDRFYFTKDNKIFPVCFPSPQDQQYFLKALDITNPKEIPAKISQLHSSELNVILKDLNNVQHLPLTYSNKTVKLQNDDFYEFDQKTKHWIKNNFYHFSPSY